MSGSVKPAIHPSVSQGLPMALGVLLVAQLFLVLVMSAREGPLDANRPEALLLVHPLEEVDRIEIAGPERPAVTLRRVGDGWRLPDYFAAPADGERIDSLLQRLATVQRGLPVATTEAAQPRFKVSETSFERRVRLYRGDETLATLYLGESPGLRQIYARTAADDAVYAVRLAAHELPVEAKGWLDPTLLAIEAGSIRELTLADGVRLRRNGESWDAEGLSADERFDPAAAEALAMRLGGLRVEQLLGSERPEDLGDTAPALMISARTEDGESVWSLWMRARSEAFVVHRSDRPWYAELADWSAEPLIEAAGRSALLREEPAESTDPDPDLGVDADHSTPSGSADR